MPPGKNAKGIARRMNIGKRFLHVGGGGDFLRIGTSSAETTESIGNHGF
jgi:hypothetical protein